MGAVDVVPRDAVAVVDWHVSARPATTSLSVTGSCLYNTDTSLTSNTVYQSNGHLTTHGQVSIAVVDRVSQELVTLVSVFSSALSRTEVVL